MSSQMTDNCLQVSPQTQRQTIANLIPSQLGVILADTISTSSLHQSLFNPSWQETYRLVERRKTEPGREAILGRPCRCNVDHTGCFCSVQYWRAFFWSSKQNEYFSKALSLQPYQVTIVKEGIKSEIIIDLLLLSSVVLTILMPCMLPKYNSEHWLLCHRRSCSAMRASFEERFNKMENYDGPLND